jgi:hypothetical protein
MPAAAGRGDLAEDRDGGRVAGRPQGPMVEIAALDRRQVLAADRRRLAPAQTTAHSRQQQQGAVAPAGEILATGGKQNLQRLVSWRGQLTTGRLPR